MLSWDIYPLRLSLTVIQMRYTLASTSHIMSTSLRLTFWTIPAVGILGATVMPHALFLGTHTYFHTYPADLLANTTPSQVPFSLPKIATVNGPRHFRYRCKSRTKPEYRAGLERGSNHCTLSPVPSESLPHEIIVTNMAGRTGNSALFGHTSHTDSSIL